MSPPKKKFCSQGVCLRSDLLEENTIDLIRSSLLDSKDNGSKLSDAGVDIIRHPFPVCVVRNVLNNTELLKTVVDDLKDIHFNEKSNDLYQFKQSDDVINLSNSVAVQQLYDCIRNEAREWTAKVFGNINLKEQISATFSSYSFQDRLLCHDDKCGDRHIAFILYLVEDWEHTDGGALQLFSTGPEGYPEGIAQNIYPEFNSLVLFEVSYVSFHQVAEVLSRKKNRISLNGWFHLENKQLGVNKCKTLNPHKIFCSDENIKLENHFKKEYFEDDVLQDIKSYFSAKSETELLGFLAPVFLDELLKDLKSEDVKWLSRGPPNIRKYDIADTSCLPPALKTLQNIFTSKSWFSYLKLITSLDFAPSQTSNLEIWENGILPQCTFEIQKWTATNYTLIHDGDPEFHCEALDVVLRLPFTDTQVKHTEEDESIPAGQVIYLDGESKDEECLLHLGDKMNCLALVFRDAKTLRFTKYLPAEAEPFFQIFCTYYQWRPSVDQPDLRHCAEESDFSEGSDDVLSDSE
ncbi:hypothetical protein RUM43_005941 [Polyplax serrata]|uniref:uS12 prolyl 3-hydroxylase n=1 Tax=Polyplax serrata TaxID=468196 RepID=A0AAN8NWZ1_POLSC